MKKAILFSSMSILIVMCLYGFVEARAGGGGGGGGGEGGVLGAVIAGLIYAVYEIRRRKMIRKAKKDLENALKTDSSWDIEGLKSRVEDVFLKYQNARSKKDLSVMMPYMTKTYYKTANGILERKLAGKKNILENISIQKLTLMSVRDNPGKDGDMFAMEVEASMIDYTIDANTKAFVRSTMKRDKNESTEAYQDRAMNSSSSFKEYYIFIRHNNKWLLNNIKEQFSIVSDIISLKEKDLRKILKEEQESDNVNDDVLYK